MERLYYGMSVPFRPFVVHEKVLDALPAPMAIEFAGLTLVKKFTMPLADILFVFLAVFDFHGVLLLALAGRHCSETAATLSD
jgi:hypothetical protein